MLLWLTGFLLSALAQTAPPFWKAKDKVYERVKNREIIVSVSAVEAAAAGPKHHLVINGGGHVKAPSGFVFKTAQDYRAIANMSGYIERADFDDKSNTLSLDFSAYGHKASMELKIRPQGASEPKLLAFEVIKGPLKGFTGEFSFVSLGAAKTEVGIRGDYRYDQFPIPKMFLEFGMEVVFQKMAWRLREFVEREHKRAGSPP